MSNAVAKLPQQTGITAFSMNEQELVLEVFAPVKGYEGTYEISNQGMVISLARVHKPEHGKRQTTRSRVLTQHSNGNGYLSVRLWADGKQCIKYVHRLVLETFLGACPAGQEACHGDGLRWHNHLRNLRWDTKKKNHADKFVHGTIRNGEKARHAKLTAEQVSVIRYELDCGEEQSILADRFLVSQPTISDVATRRTWKHI